jgi:aromatic ring-cleaving dioxygenase
MTTQLPIHHFSRYHAHVYFEQESVEKAASLCRQAGELFAVQVGRIHRRPVGPHPHWSCQLAFDRAQFEPLMAWLQENRGDLSVLVHPLSGNDLDDHTTHASWLGDAVPLHLAALGAV